MLFSLVLTALSFSGISLGAVLPARYTEVKTAVSPDGFTYVIESESYIDETITLENGSTVTVQVHPRFKFHKRQPQPGTSLNLAKRLSWYSGTPDECGAASFENVSSGASPSTSDCGAIRDYYASANGHYYATWLGDLHTGGAYTRLVITGTCVFGVKTANACGINVGSSDISDLTRDSINMYGGAGVIGAQGNMGCASDCGQTASVDWAIFHN